MYKHGILHRTIVVILAVFLVTMVAGPQAWAQIVIPQRGQTPEQIATDQAQCQAFARQVVEQQMPQQAAEQQNAEVVNQNPRLHFSGQIDRKKLRGVPNKNMYTTKRGLSSSRRIRQTGDVSSSAAYEQAFAACMMSRGYSVQ